MMRKINIVLVLVVMLLLSACGKDSKPINIPNSENIKTIKSHVLNQSSVIEFTEDDARSIIVKINEAQLTGIESVSDCPTNVDNYYVLELITEDEQVNTLYIYEQKSKWFIEQPYQGIYKTDKEILQLIGFTDVES